jgi:hypothetical protein
MGAVCSTYHAASQSTPGQLVFGRDMIWDTAHVADWQHVKQRKQTLTVSQVGTTKDNIWLHLARATSREIRKK